MTVNPTAGFDYSDGLCAYVTWLTIPDYWFQVHFVQQKFKRDGSISIQGHERNVVRTHLNSLTWPNAFSGTRIGFSVTSFASFVRDVSSTLHVVERSDKHIVAVAPFGYLFHIFEEEDATFQREALTRLYPPSFQSPHLVEQPGSRGFLHRTEVLDFSQGRVVLLVVTAFLIFIVGQQFAKIVRVPRVCF